MLPQYLELLGKAPRQAAPDAVSVQLQRLAQLTNQLVGFLQVGSERQAGSERQE